jgi:hypothetical protein
VEYKYVQSKQEGERFIGINHRQIKILQVFQL